MVNKVKEPINWWPARDIRFCVCDLKPLATLMISYFGIGTTMGDKRAMPPCLIAKVRKSPICKISRSTSESSIYSSVIAIGCGLTLKSSRYFFGWSTQSCIAAVQQILNACISNTTVDFTMFFSKV